MRKDNNSFYVESLLLEVPEFYDGNFAAYINIKDFEVISGDPDEKPTVELLWRLASNAEARTRFIPEQIELIEQALMRIWHTNQE